MMVFILPNCNLFINNRRYKPNTSHAWICRRCSPTLVYGAWKFLLLLTLAFFLLGNARSNTGANTSLLAILSSSQRHNQQRRYWYWTIYIGDTVLKVSKWIIIAETIASRWSGNEPMMSGLGRAAEIEPNSSYLKLWAFEIVKYVNISYQGITWHSYVSCWFISVILVISREGGV